MTYKADERVAELAGDSIAWLTTVTPKGRPAPRPVWFVFDGEDVLVFSRPGTAKLKHIQENPEVSFHFNTGRGVVVINGRAHTEEGKASEAPGYLDKYSRHYAGIGYPTDASFDESFSVQIRVVPERTWGH